MDWNVATRKGIHIETPIHLRIIGSKRVASILNLVLKQPNKLIIWKRNWHNDEKFSDNWRNEIEEVPICEEEGFNPCREGEREDVPSWWSFGCGSAYCDAAKTIEGEVEGWTMWLRGVWQHSGNGEDISSEVRTTTQLVLECWWERGNKYKEMIRVCFYKQKFYFAPFNYNSLLCTFILELNKYAMWSQTFLNVYFNPDKFHLLI